MKYDFTTIMDRHGMDAIAVDGLSEDGQGSPAKPKEGFDIIPMWVADMNFTGGNCGESKAPGIWIF